LNNANYYIQSLSLFDIDLTNWYC